MKLSKQTVNLLSNYSDINDSIVINEGNRLSTVSVGLNILAEAIVDEEFPCKFAIYDLAQFLKALRLFNDPELIFSKNYVTLHEGKDRLRYYFADPNVVIVPPDGGLELPSQEVTFQVNERQLNKLNQAASLLDLPDLSVIGRDGSIFLSVGERENGTTNAWEVEVGETDHTFLFNFKIENVNVLPGTYDVSISKQCLSYWKNTSSDLSYFIAVEPDPQFE
jgi:hypothetical protein